jgi:hypothetical protein
MTVSIVVWSASPINAFEAVIVQIPLSNNFKKYTENENN